MSRIVLRSLALFAVAALAAALPHGSLAVGPIVIPIDGPATSPMLVRGIEAGYSVSYLTSDGAVSAANEDPVLVNAWGLASSSTSPWWVANNGTATAAILSAEGVPQTLVVHVPGAPTGEVASSGDELQVTDGTNSGPARFLFASEDGTISAWSPAVPPPAPSNQAFVVIDRSSSGAVYKGLAIAETESGVRLYATDFHNARVDVFDASYDRVTPEGAFADPRIPEGYAPFGIREVQGRIVVTYAKQDSARHDDLAGQGLGFVDVYDTEGTLLARAATRGLLNAPWGIALAPANFGPAGGNLLIGNFGDGRILAYRMTTDMRRFAPVGQLRDAGGSIVSIDGLWALSFGNGSAAGATNQLFFTAGPDGERHGGFGRIDAPTP